jgi:hypothetical protein
VSLEDLAPVAPFYALSSAIGMRCSAAAASLQRYYVCIGTQSGGVDCWGGETAVQEGLVDDAASVYPSSMGISAARGAAPGAWASVKRRLDASIWVGFRLYQ